MLSNRSTLIAAGLLFLMLAATVGCSIPKREPTTLGEWNRLQRPGF
ncbi:MAG: hypothetical protein VXZ82_23725 [Planctomycetota bacterium]|nr:hypothetical protein [Planctomycetota bacterium]